jgi:hypothetical protein
LTNSLKDLETLNAEGKRTPARVSARVRAFALIALMLAAICGLQSCGGGSGTGTTTIKSVSITPTLITVPLNTQTHFLAVVTLSDSTISSTATLTWEVNGMAGGDLLTVGSIVTDPDNPLQGDYTAPGSVPTVIVDGVTQLGQVVVTAVATQTTTTTSSSGTPPTVTSNNGIVTVGAGSGLAVNPPSVTVPAGGNQQFTALLNGLNDPSASWSITPAGDPAVYGSINSSGIYAAPLSPPPGGTVMINAADPAAPAPASAIATIVYSDRSLNGQYAFSYTGNDGSGFLAVAGSFVTNGQGTILSGVEDVSSFLTGVRTEIPIQGTSTYLVGADGRGTATIITKMGTNTWDFVLTTPAHAQLTRFDASNTGGGTIDQQSLGAVSNSASVITGSYVFDLLGADSSFNALGLAGKFTANGAGGIPESGTILDVNDNGINGGTVTTNDTSLNGTYAFDPAFPGTGRGTLSLTSTTTGANPRMYAFYTVDAPSNPNGPDFVMRLHLIEIDRAAFVAGDMYSSPAGPSTLTAGNYVFTGGGNVLVPVAGQSSTLGAYAAGGVLISNGTSAITGGVFDANTGGTYNSGPSLSNCSYTTDPTTGRIALLLSTAGGACPTPNASTNEYAVYQTSQGTALFLEIDKNALSTGTIYQQCVPPAAACSSSVTLAAGSFAIGLTGQGIFHNNSTLYQSALSGQLTLLAAAISSGTLDINTFSSVSQSAPISATGSSIGTIASNGRGTATLATSTPAATFKLVFYLIDDNTAVLFDQDTTPIAIGSLLRQF